MGCYRAMITKRFLPVLVVALLALVIIGVVLDLAPANNRRYRAESLVLATPFTNSFFARSFEAHVIHTIPGIARLLVSPTFSGVPTPGAPAVTNGVGIRIVAFGPTPEKAEQAANEAAMQLSRTVSTNYGVRGEIADVARSARKYSYFHDTFEPAVGRMFKH